MPVDWPRFLRHSGQGQTSAFFAEVARGSSAVQRPRETEPRAGAGVRELLEQAPPNQRHKLLLAHVREQAAKVLGSDANDTIDPRQPLQELGLDSLMAVELRNLLGAGLGLSRSLPSTLVFDHPTIAALTDYLAAEVLSFDGASKDAPPPAADVVGQIEDLSDEEVERLLSRKATGAR
jgi:acyl carrier protein